MNGKLHQGTNLLIILCREKSNSFKDILWVSKIQVCPYSLILNLVSFCKKLNFIVIHAYQELRKQVLLSIFKHCSVEVKEKRHISIFQTGMHICRNIHIQIIINLLSKGNVNKTHVTHLDLFPHATTLCISACSEAGGFCKTVTLQYYSVHSWSLQHRKSHQKIVHMIN